MTTFRAFDDAWRSFVKSESVVTFDEALTAHAKGRGQMLAFIVPIEDPDLLDLLAGIHDRIAPISGISLVPEEDLHITVKLAGFQVLERTFDDDILREEVPGLDRQAAAFFKSLPAFTVQIGKPNAFPDAVIIEVEDDGMMQKLNASLMEYVPSVHRYPSDSPNFLPHVTIARFEENLDLETLKQEISSLRADPVALPIHIRAIVLARYWLLATGAESDPIKSYYLRSP